MKDIVKIFILIIFLAIGKMSLAQCNFYNQITVSASGFQSAGGYTQEYAVVSNETSLITHINGTGSFSSVIPGQYFVYAVNYDGARPGSLSIGNPWSGVVNYAVSNCFDIIGPYTNGLVNVCDDVCTNEPFTTTASSFYTGGISTETYVLVNYPSVGNNILASNNSGSFTNSDYSGDGVYAVYAVNTEDPAVTSTLISPTAWNTSNATIIANCADIIGPFLVDVGAGVCILPFENLSFEGTKNKSSNTLNWLLNSQDEIANYEIERSNNGNDFEVLSATKSQNYTDKNPLKTSYYRLKIRFENGESKYSNIVKLERDDNFSMLSIYPNPTSGIINLTVQSQGGQLNVDITNSLGQMVIQEKIFATEGINNIAFDISSLPNALYYLSLTDGNKRHIEKLNKIK